MHRGHFRLVPRRGARFASAVLPTMGGPMPTTAEVLSEFVHIAEAPFRGHARLRTQAACVRTLYDEISRYDSTDRRFAALREQLQAEVAQLACLLEEAATPDAPASGIRLRG